MWRPRATNAPGARRAGLSPRFGGGGGWWQVVIWGLLFVVYAIQFRIQWLIIIIVALSLSTANIVGYT